MNEEDMSDIFKKINDMINNSKFSNSDNISSSEDDVSSNINENTFNFNNTTASNNNFNLDFNTILKFKNIMDNFNSFNSSPETNLLLSLKPYLNNSRQQKLDQYMQYLKLVKLFENLNSNGDVNIK